MGNKGYHVQPNILFWIRLKTLQCTNEINKILQIAYIYTDMKLSIFHSGSQITIQCSKQILDSLSPSEQKLLKTSGIYDACVNSKIGIEAAESMIMRDIEERKIVRGQLLAAGKQVHLVKYALMQHMPRLYDFLHYRIFDLDSVNLAVERFKSVNSLTGDKFNEFGDGNIINKSQQQDEQKEKVEQKNVGYKRAQEQVWEDIHEMQFYLQHALNDN